MAIAQTATASQGFDNSDPITMAFDCAGGDLLVLGIYEILEQRVGGAPTYNGVAMTDSGQGIVEGASRSIVEMWFVVNPAAGSNTISIPNTSDTNINLAVSAWSGVDTADPLDTSESDFSASGNTASVTLTTAAANELIIDAMEVGEGTIPSANSHTLIFSISTGAQCTNAQYTLDDGSGGITLDWTLGQAGEDWAMIVAAFNPSGVTPSRRVFIIS